MIQIRPPYEYLKYSHRETSLFLGGGISGCPNWQADAVNHLRMTDLVIYNPRRDNFDITDPKITTEQINWEHKYLKLSNIVCFWFPKETLCPITLFELGKELLRRNVSNLFVGCHPDYQRIIDVEVQVNLEHPHIKIYRDLEDMCMAIAISVL